jgi:hypothetical protein
MGKFREILSSIMHIGLSEEVKKVIENEIQILSYARFIHEKAIILMSDLTDKESTKGKRSNGNIETIIINSNRIIMISLDNLKKLNAEKTHLTRALKEAIEARRLLKIIIEKHSENQILKKNLEEMNLLIIELT